MVNSCKINHFGMKPVRGGRPPSDRRVRVVMVMMAGVLVQFMVSVLIFVECISLNVRNVADVIIIYVRRARMVSCGLNCTITIIHPRWAMDE